MTKLKVASLVLVAMLVLSCGPPVKLTHPAIVITFGNVALVIENASWPSEEVQTIKGDLAVVPDGNTGYYTVQGSGTFSVRGRTFDYFASALTCRCEEFDPSKGAVVVRRDGSLVPAYLLPLLAR